MIHVEIRKLGQDNRVVTNAEYEADYRDDGWHVVGPATKPRPKRKPKPEPATEEG